MKVIRKNMNKIKEFFSILKFISETDGVKTTIWEKIYGVSLIMLFVGFIGIGITWVFSCKGIAQFGCSDSYLVIVFAGITFLSIILIFLSNPMFNPRINKNDGA
jgi:hypothetical protein